MKVLHISTYDNTGGAARATYRIHKSLMNVNVDSRMKVIHKSMNENTIDNWYKKKWYHDITIFFYNRWLFKLKRKWKHSNKEMHSYGRFGIDIIEEINKSDFNIVHLHWICEMLSIEDIGKIKKPLVWTMHDMWPFCGAEHYAFENENKRFINGYLVKNRDKNESGLDINRTVWLKKYKHWQKLNITIISTSNWLFQSAKNSSLFKKYNHHLIPYPLETKDFWFPIEKEVSRKALNLPLDCNLILMGAEGGINNPRKGGDLLKDAFSNLIKKSKEKINLVIFGQSNPNSSYNDEEFNIHWLGSISDDRILRLAYSAADVMIVPSRQEAFGQTATESLACGTPVVAFDIGGLSDIVDHKVNGWLSPPFDTEDMATGINWILQDKENHKLLSQKGRDLTLDLYDPKKIASKYLEVYKEILELTKKP